VTSHTIPCNGGATELHWNGRGSVSGMGARRSNRVIVGGLPQATAFEARTNGNALRTRPVRQPDRAGRRGRFVVSHTLCVVRGVVCPRSLAASQSSAAGSRHTSQGERPPAIRCAHEAHARQCGQNGLYLGQITPAATGWPYTLGITAVHPSHNTAARHASSSTSAAVGRATALPFNDEAASSTPVDICLCRRSGERRPPRRCQARWYVCFVRSSQRYVCRDRA
jgi:hypothetical protein